jgi:hypothetical protein
LHQARKRWQVSQKVSAQHAHLTCISSTR